MPKMSKFVDDIFKSNENQPELLTRDNVWEAARFFTYKCRPEMMSSFLREFKKYEQIIEVNCSEQQKVAEERKQKLKQDTGVPDKELRLPDLGTVTYDDFTYSRYAAALQKRNPDQIMTREKVDNAVANLTKRMYTGKSAHQRELPEDSFRTKTKKAADKYWARQKQLEDEEEIRVQR